MRYLNQLMIGTGLLLCLNACSTREDKLGCCDARSLNYDVEATIDNGLCQYSDAYIYSNPDSISSPDKDGNLIIINESRESLHLYAGTKHLKVIPPKTNNYLVNIPAFDEKQELTIYKVSQTDDVTQPDPEKTFKRWVVILPSDRLPENRLKWVVSEFATSAGNGTLRLQYPTQQDGFQYSYNTDVYLQSKTGAYMVSLTPGKGYSLKLDYGVYKLYYKYWYSQAGDAAAQTEVGWLESPYLTVNAAHSETNILIPGFNAVPQQAALLHINNQLDETVNVYWGNCLIEDLVFGYENTNGLSALSSGHETLYYLEEGENTLSARALSGNVVETLNTITLVNGMTAHIDFGADRQEIYGSNRTDQTIYIATPDYTGVALKPNEERFIKLPSDISTCHVFNVDSTFFKKIELINQNLTIN
ncbi:MAG: hypothetical protein JEZ14_18255 [Marinilabiliaceae bacterium]|nr:hypothetical protein [Marinilabiliaceae bacterium]